MAWTTKVRGAELSSTGAVPKPPGRVLAVQRIDVFKNSFKPDLALRLELTSGETYLVPIGPKLAGVLIESLDRAVRAVPAPSMRQ